MSSQATITPREQALHEPRTDQFHTQHSVGPNRAVALQGLALLTEVGSTVHGVSQQGNGDDVDEMGICIEDAATVLGLGTFEQYEYRSQPVNVRSGPGDIDRVVYGLRKWASLASKGNPTVLMPLFTDEDKHVRYINWAGRMLRENKQLFLSKQAGSKFLGYLDGQRKRYLDPARADSKHASRPELVEKYGWDTKTGYHALRLAIQGRQLMGTGHTIPLPMAEKDREFLLKVRGGEYTKEEVTQMLDDAFIPILKASIETSTLPDKPDYQGINALLVAMYQSHWKFTNAEQDGLI